MTEISKVIKSIFDQIDVTIDGVYDPDSGRTNVCFTKWARAGKIVKDELDREYLLTEVESDLYVIGTAVDPLNLDPLEGIIYLPNPFWISGTRYVTNAEWSKFSNNLNTKLPLVWLLEVLRYRRFGKDSTLDFTAELRIFFLDETNVTQYLNSEHRENVVEPMELLLNSFLDVIRSNRIFRPIDDYEVITFSRFGTETEQGVFKNILDANLSGVELIFSLSKYKDKCKC